MIYQDNREVGSILSEERIGIIDLGSNSVRLVIFEGRHRNPQIIFNEKSVIGLGRGMHATNRLNEAAMELASVVLQRYQIVAAGMGVKLLKILATAAIRDAENGMDFVSKIQKFMPEISITVLSGEDEAKYCADGLLLGFPSASGLLADLGGGSLELVFLRDGNIEQAASLPIGTIRLNERADGKISRARTIVEQELASLPWLADVIGANLFPIGGAFRALARIHMTQTSYPLSIVHHYTIRRDEARNLADFVTAAPRRSLERIASAPMKRLNDLPFAAVVMRSLLRSSKIERVVFSANGLREGWYARNLPEAVRASHPLLAAAAELAATWGRDAHFPQAVAAWMAPLALSETAEDAVLLRAAAFMCDIGSHDHPEYRAEQSFLRVLRQHGVGLDHPARAFLALTVALRYECEPNAAFLDQAKVLLDPVSLRRAETLGAVLRLAFTLSGGVASILTSTAIAIDGQNLVLRFQEGKGVFAGESIIRRLEAVANALDLRPRILNITPGQ